MLRKLMLSRAIVTSVAMLALEGSAFVVSGDGRIMSAFQHAAVARIASAPTAALRAIVGDHPAELKVTLPETDNAGIYNITNPEQHEAFLGANPDKIIVLKIYAPFCKACKGLAPKFQRLSREENYSSLPILWARMSTAGGNAAYIKSLGARVTPSVLLYAGGEEPPVENFPCGPRKVGILRKKLSDLIESRIDPSTLKLKRTKESEPAEMAEDAVVSAEPFAPRAASSLSDSIARDSEPTVAGSETNYLDTLGSNEQIYGSSYPEHATALFDSPRRCTNGIATYLDAITNAGPGPMAERQAHPSLFSHASTASYLDSIASGESPGTSRSSTGYLDALPSGAFVAAHSNTPTDWFLSDLSIAKEDNGISQPGTSYLDTLNT